VRVLGLDPWRQAVELKRQVGYVAEEQLLPVDLTVGQVFDLHRQLFPSWDPTLESRLRERFSIREGARIGQLSKGEARQVALLCAVAHRPKLLLLDEPAGGLDPAARRGILEAAIGLLSEAGSTVVFSSHHMADVERIAGRVVLLHEGGVLLDGDLDSIRESYSLAVVSLDSLRDRPFPALAACVRARRTPSGWHAVFSLPPDEVETLLASQLGNGHAACQRIPLEELFVEMVEGHA
jgi:ABC-2 type transport system ATP-binding protein